jgi:hypothetical protein|tara:strand:- start:420 stop:1151 length:732 start_codon:yes stop_codon:yes gene_type:complete
METELSQDSKQKMNVMVSFGLEFYRVLMGCMLMVFVPQKCGEELCGFGENILNGNKLVDAGFFINLVTCLVFCGFYFVEVKRENKLINYLEVNDDIPNDNDEVGKMLLKLPSDKRGSLLKMDKLYQRLGYVAMIFFVINSAYSGIPIFINYLDNKTITVYVTNVMFLAFKITDSYAVVNTDTNEFLSAYLSTKVQFNDVDPDKCFIGNAHPRSSKSLSIKNSDKVELQELTSTSSKEVAVEDV